MIKATCTKCPNSFSFKENIVIDMRCPQCGGSIFRLISISAQTPNSPEPEQTKDNPKISRAK